MCSNNLCHLPFCPAYPAGTSIEIVAYECKLYSEQQSQCCSLTAQMMKLASHGINIALDLAPRGHPFEARSLHQADEALREHLLPYLSFPMLMALSRASSDWHHLIFTTTLTHPAGHANRKMLPCGMISHQSLREVLQERGSLLARLRRQHKPGYAIGVDASHDPAPMQNPTRCHEQGMCILTWSPQPDISQPSQHILISGLQTYVNSDSGFQGYERIASVLDLSTGRPVEFRAARSCIVPFKPAALGADFSQESVRQAVPGRERLPDDMARYGAGNDQHKLDESQQEAQEHNLAQCINIGHAKLAAWTADARHVIIILSGPRTSPHPAGSRGRTGSLILVDTLLHSRLMLFPQAHERFPPGAISPAGNMILSQSSHPPDFDISLNLYQLPSLQHQFSVGPPIFSDDHYHGPLKYQQFAWSPDGSKLAVWWAQDRPILLAAPHASSLSASSTSNYVTVHRADDGECLTSTRILPGSQPKDVHSTQDSDSSDRSYSTGSYSDRSYSDRSYSDRSYSDRSYSDSDSSDDNETRDAQEDLSDDNDHGFPGIEWNSASSCVIWASKDTVACIGSVQGQVWQLRCWVRSKSSGEFVRTIVGPAASTQFILVADHLLGILTMLKPMLSSSRVTLQRSISIGSKDMVWAAQSDVCLRPDHGCVLMPAAAANVAVENAYQVGVGHVYWEFPGRGLSTRHPVCKPEGSDIFQHSWHEFALTAPASSGSEGTSSLPYSRGYETYTMHISPCGTVVVGVKNNNSWDVGGQPSGSKATFHHWHLPHVRKCPRTPLAGGNGTLNVRPQECIGLVMPSQKTLHLAWHPQPRACTYACYDYQVGLRLVNAKSDCIVRSWTIAELAEYICEESAMSARIESLEKKQSRVVPGSALAWSHDGCRLAVLVGKHCAVLHF